MSKRSRPLMLLSVVALAATARLAVADTNIRFTAVTFLDPATLRLVWLDDGKALGCTATVGAVSSRFYRVSASPEPTNRFYVVERCDRLGQPFSPCALVMGAWSGTTTTNQGTEMDDSLIFFGAEPADYVIQWGVAETITSM